MTQYNGIDILQVPTAVEPELASQIGVGVAFENLPDDCFSAGFLNGLMWSTSGQYHKSSIFGKKLSIK